MATLPPEYMFPKGHQTFRLKSVDEVSDSLRDRYELALIDAEKAVRAKNPELTGAKLEKAIKAATAQVPLPRGTHHFEWDHYIHTGFLDLQNGYAMAIGAVIGAVNEDSTKTFHKALEGDVVTVTSDLKHRGWTDWRGAGPENKPTEGWVGIYRIFDILIDPLNYYVLIMKEVE